MVQKLSSARLILLAATHASDSNVSAFRAVTLSNLHLFRPELILRLLLTFLPESVPSVAYTPFLEEVHSLVNQHDPDHTPTALENLHVDQQPVQQLSEDEAQKRLRKLSLRRLRPQLGDGEKSAILRQAPNQPLTLFLIQRAHAIEEATGLLTVVPELITPFLDASLFLRVWYVSTVLPLLRFDYEYYGVSDPAIDLRTFESFEGAAGVNVLMSRSTVASREGNGDADAVGRDLRGMVGPWTFGSTQRKRRKLDGYPIQGTQADLIGRNQAGNSETTSVRKEEDTTTSEDQLEDWQHTFRWMLTSAVDNFDLAVQVVEGWRGPSDIDTGDVEKSSLLRVNDEIQSHLHLQYCQAALATIYASESDSLESIRGAHRILVQVAEMMGYPMPPELETRVASLPSLERQIGERPIPLEAYNQRNLQFDELLQRQQPLTVPTMQAFALSNLLVHSTFVLNELGFTSTVAQVAKLSFYGDESDASHLVRKILENVSTSSKANESNWIEVRQQLIWLSDWNAKDNSSTDTFTGQGVLRSLSRGKLEHELLRAIGSVGQYGLLRSVYLQPDDSLNPLSYHEVEEVIIELFDDFYANASNGNKTRGSMKKAADLLATFHPIFASSPGFHRASALLSATHSLSFYALTLTPGTPTAPVRIRESKDPLSMIRVVLSQNLGSYTKLDDLVSIASNLVVASPDAFSSTSESSPYVNVNVNFPADEKARVEQAGRLVTGMAIEAALEEDDFETAYSYVVNKLSLALPSQAQAHSSTNTKLQDDTSWRAAYHAGRHHSSASVKGLEHERTRRLEQRMDLLSRALSLGPDAALPDILAAWRRCEEELLTVLQDEAEAEAEADEIADKRLSGVRMSGNQELPGAFSGEQPALLQGQVRRKEVGRANRADGEAPMGLFDVARGAAEAFGRMGQKPQKQGSLPSAEGGELDEEFEDGQERVRKRDMVANAVTGGMARGIGWVLGAAPVSEPEQRENG